MQFRFKFQNDCSEPGDHCIRCGHFTQERCQLRFPGFRLTVFTCRPCLAEIGFLFWWLYEAPFRAFMKAKEAAESGHPEVQYENSFNWSSEATSPLPKTAKVKQKKEAKGFNLLPPGGLSFGRAAKPGRDGTESIH